MAYTDSRHHTARFGKLPRGFTRHRGKDSPIKGEVYVELVHRTDEGFAVSPRLRAKFVHDDSWALPAKEPGSIVAWRLAPEVSEPRKPVFLDLPPPELPAP
jgi:hypothetical protein